MNRTALFCLALLALFGTAYAYDLNGACIGFGSYDTNQMGDFNAMGDCIVKGGFDGDLRLLGIVIFLVFVFFAWQIRLPLPAALGLGLIMAFGLAAPGMNFPEAGLLITLGLLAMGVMVFMMLLHFFRRG